MHFTTSMHPATSSGIPKEGRPRRKEHAGVFSGLFCPIRSRRKLGNIMKRV